MNHRFWRFALVFAPMGLGCSQSSGGSGHPTRGSSAGASGNAAPGGSTGSGGEWAGFKGCNLRLANRNTLVNYGSGGVICEITPDRKRVFQVKFDVPTGDDYYNKMVGNNVLLADLYALNGGGPK